MATYSAKQNKVTLTAGSMVALFQRTEYDLSCSGNAKGPRDPGLTSPLWACFPFWPTASASLKLSL